MVQERGGSQSFMEKAAPIFEITIYAMTICHFTED
jgi:hypothetical protein